MPVEWGRMPARRQYRDRDRVEVAILDALVDRHGEGMTVFELRSRVPHDIDEIEAALANLKGADLVEVETGPERLRIYPDERVLPPEDDPDDEDHWLDELRGKLPF